MPIVRYNSAGVMAATSVPPQADLSPLRTDQPQQHLHERRLAGAVGPHHGDQLAGSGAEGQAVQGHDPVGIGVMDRVGFDRQGAGRVGHKGHLSASTKATTISPAAAAAIGPSRRANGGKLGSGSEPW